MRRALAAALIAGACLGAASRGAGAEGASLRGRVELGVPGLALAAVAPVVVYLEPGPDAAPDAARRAPAVMNQSDARFSPAFLVVGAGQAVRMANDDTIYHNVFSYSRPNDFDLGLYPAGESRSVELRHPGVVKVYCSIHETMNATILVAPTPWFATVAASGRYRLPDLPAGRYRAVVWSERLPPASREIRLQPGEARRLDWVIGAPPAQSP